MATNDLCLKLDEKIVCSDPVARSSKLTLVALIAQTRFPCFCESVNSEQIFAVNGLLNMTMLVVSISWLSASCGFAENGKTGVTPPSKADVGETKKSSQGRLSNATENHGPRPNAVGLGTEFSEVLLVPSLTKDQQTRLRVLYIKYQQQRAKLRSDLAKNFLDKRNQKKAMQAIQIQKNRSSAAIGEEILYGLLETKTDAVSDPRTMQIVSDFKKRLTTEDIKFTRDVLAVLTKAQHKELREIGKATGSPDFFVKLAEDTKKLGTAAVGRVPCRNKNDL